jgi:hypothetical protein
VLFGTFALEVCNLCALFRGSFERNSISSYFDKLLEADIVVVRDIIPLLQVLLGILPNISALILSQVPIRKGVFSVHTVSGLLHIPIRLPKEVMRAGVVW